jgi:hypothetical protein
MFLLFDHLTVSTFLDSDEVSEVGGSDAEFGFSEPLFLAEKNVYSPAQKETKALETYKSRCAGLVSVTSQTHVTTSPVNRELERSTRGVLS